VVGGLVIRRCSQAIWRRSHTMNPWVKQAEPTVEYSLSPPARLSDGSPTTVSETVRCTSMSSAQSHTRPLPAGTTATSPRPIALADWCSEPQAAALLGLSVKTLRNRRAAGQIAFWRPARGAVFYHPDDLARQGVRVAPSEEFAQTGR
jgi:hypothetical protein